MTNRPERRPRNAATLLSLLPEFHFQALALWHSQVQHWRSASPRVPPRGSLSISTAPLFSLSLPLSSPPGQFLLEESRLLEAAEMAEKAARLDAGEFDVVFSAAHMLR